MPNAAPSKSSSPAASPHWFNPFVPRFRDDPHPMLHRLRAESPVHYCALANTWFLTRYKDVQTALLDDVRVSADSRHWDEHARFFHRPGPQDAAGVYSRWMLQMDPPDHSRLRVLLNGAFTPRVVQKLRANIRSLVDRLMAPMFERGKGDFVKDLAYPLPILVIAELLGVPREDGERLRTWSEQMIPSLNPAMGAQTSAKVNNAVRECGAYFLELIHQRRANPTEDLISRLAAARDGGHQLTDDEVVATCLLLAFAGHLTTVQLVAGMLLLFIQHPDQLARVRRDTALRVSAIEESLRVVSPLQFIFRTTKQAVTLGEAIIPARQMVFAHLAGANRDPEVFPDPDRFDVSRSPNRHLAFGQGIHYCAGAALGRMEADIVLEVLCEQITAAHLTGPIKRDSSLLLRSIEAMPVAFER
jgi:cytochrome P450